MTYVVCYSGGHSSALTAIEAVRKHGKENVVLLNHDISSHVEHEDIKRFKRDVADYLDLDITYVNAVDFENMTPIKVCTTKGTFDAGRPGQTICTYGLKTRPFQLYLMDNWNTKDPCSGDITPCRDMTILYGFDANEPDRIQRRAQMLGKDGYATDFPLALWDKTIDRTEEIGIPRPITYKVYKHANCIGCLKAGKQHWYCVYCLRPDIWQEAKEAEALIGRSILKHEYLEELEPQFKEMHEELGICPSDKGNSAAFWARVNKALPGQIDMFSCECAI